MAIWQTEIRGVHWLEELADAGNAIHLGGNGYPYRFTARASRLLPTVLEGPPYANSRWMYEVGDIRGPDWEGRTTLDREAIARCDPNEWLIVEVWDES